MQFLNSKDLKWYEARRPKNHLGGQILHKIPRVLKTASKVKNTHILIVI